MAKRWEYCSMRAAAVRDASGGVVGEVLSLTLPGAGEAMAEHPLGGVGLLNQLGGDGWEAVSDCWTSVFERIVLMKRRRRDPL